MRKRASAYFSFYVKVYVYNICLIKGKFCLSHSFFAIVDERLSRQLQVLVCDERAWVRTPPIAWKKSVFDIEKRKKEIAQECNQIYYFIYHIVCEFSNQFYYKKILIIIIIITFIIRAYLPHHRQELITRVNPSKKICV